MEKAAQPRLTPMYEQYLKVKAEYPDALLFYRMGDFYELFFEDAEVASRELQLALTSRNRSGDDCIPMCGVPWHAAEAYISQLVDKGYKIAVCDQVEDPRTAKGLVKRAVTRVVTAGTTLEDANLEAKFHNYLGALCWNAEHGAGGFAWMDVSTGEWSGIQSSREPELWQWVFKLAPRELLLPEQAKAPAHLGLQTGIQVVRVPWQSHFEPRKALARVLKVQGVMEAGALGLDKRPELAQACGALVAYLEQTQKQDSAHLAPFHPLDMGRFMVLDEITERNLELFRRLDGRRGVGTLWQVLDQTRTPMGGRRMEERLRYPWRELSPIIETQAVVAYIAEHTVMRNALRKALDGVHDLERLSTRISLNRCQPRDLSALRDSLNALPAVKQAILNTEDSADLPTAEEARGDFLPGALFRLIRRWDGMRELAELLEKALVDEPPLQITDGGLFKAGYNAELDELLELVEHGESRLQALLAAEQQACNQPKMKMGYNRVFGYYFELTRSRQSQLPERFERRQSLVNAERFTTPELKELEEKLLSAADRRKSLEYRLYQDLRETIGKARERLLFMGDLLAWVDYWQALGEISVRLDWCRPEMHEGSEIHIHEGRHPVVEAVTGRASFIPNDLHMDDERRLLLITGPNMAGKSTVLRQTAIICILAQMGSFVPAGKARIGIVDRVFSRVGASDNLAQGQSTFMVEMMETARILRQATRRSLVILDEIGRGTSTFDGLALAWAVVEDLARRVGGHIRTLFATHYHELTSLEGIVAGVHNMNIAIREWNGEIVFLRRLIPGPADRSYGIEVARLAGVPMPVVQRARDILAQLEQSRGKSGVCKIEAVPLPGVKLTSNAASPCGEKRMEKTDAPHPLLQALRDTDPDALTPLAALKLIADWKKLWGKDNEKKQ